MKVFLSYCAIAIMLFSVPAKLMKIFAHFASEPKMSAGISALALTEEDVTKMLAATTHIGSDNSETTMEQYVWKKKTDGVSNLFLSLNLWPC